MTFIVMIEHYERMQTSLHFSEYCMISVNNLYYFHSDDIRNKILGCHFYHTIQFPEASHKRMIAR